MENQNLNIWVDILIAGLGVLGSLAVAYFTAIWTVRREKSSGKAQLLDICHRYLMIFWNALDSKTGRIKKNELSYLQYIKELRTIIDDLSALSNNVYVETLILNYHEISRLQVILRRELIEHESKENKLVSLNTDTLSEIFNLRSRILDELPDKNSESIMSEDIEKIKEAFLRMNILIRSGKTPKGTLLVSNNPER